MDTRGISSYAWESRESVGSSLAAGLHDGVGKCLQNSRRPSWVDSREIWSARCSAFESTRVS